MPGRICAVAVVVPDCDRAIAFHTGTLGLALIEDTDPANTGRRALVAPPGVETRLMLARPVTPAQHAAIGNQAGGCVGFFLTTTDFEGVHARMSTQRKAFEQ